MFDIINALFYILPNIFLWMPAMKKIIPTALIVISFLVFPLIGNASYTIHLKDGGKFVTSKYWEENGQIKFLVSGGTIGVDKDTVEKIEKSKINADEYEVVHSPTAGTGNKSVPEKEIKIIPPASAGEKTVDLKEYRAKMKELRGKLNESLKKIREAPDKEAKEKAYEEMRSISNDIYALIDEVKKKTNGKTPENWWHQE